MTYSGIYSGSKRLQLLWSTIRNSNTGGYNDFSLQIDLYAKNSYESSPGIRRMECSIGDVKLGKKLSDNLRKIPGVIRVANYCYNKSYKTERRPDNEVNVM